MTDAAMTTTARWYVAETQTNQERKAAEHIKRQGFEVYLPMRMAPPTARLVAAVPFFPRYLFVHLDHAIGWNALFTAIGFKALIGNGGRPIPLADSIVEYIRAKERDGYLFLEQKAKGAPEFSFRKGDRVAVRDGVMAGLQAMFCERIDEKRAWILLSLLGRDSKVQVQMATLELQRRGGEEPLLRPGEAQECLKAPQPG